MRYLFIFSIFLIFSCQSENETSEAISVNDHISDSLTIEDTISLDTIENQEPLDFSEYNQITFGFADLDGDTVIMLDKPDSISVSDYTYAFSSSGKLDVVHLNSQKATDEDNNRRNAYNLKNMEGELFAVQDQKAPLWEAIMFTPKSFIQKRQHLTKSTPYDSRVLNSNQIATIEKDKNWTIVTTDHLESNSEGSLYFAYFKKKQDSVLVSLVWVTESGNSYLDFPAIYNETSTWRVDDGGVFDAEYFKIISIFKSDKGIEIMTDWMGAEGSSVNYYLVSEGTFTLVKSTYFYSAPL